jgi:hypothetical protein
MNSLTALLVLTTVALVAAQAGTQQPFDQDQQQGNQNPWPIPGWVSAPEMAQASRLSTVYVNLVIEGTDGLLGPSVILYNQIIPMNVAGYQVQGMVLNIDAQAYTDNSLGFGNGKRT